MLWQLFWTFLEIGAVSFGGGYGMISLIREKVLLHGWLEETQFLSFIAVSESTPGPLAINMATFIGASQAGAAGAFCATLGVVLPSFFIILLIAALIHNLLQYAGVNAFLSGIRPCVVALILATAVTMGLSSLLGVSTLADTPAPAWQGIGILAALLLLHFGWQKWKGKAPSPIAMILVSAVLGMVVYHWKFWTFSIADVWRKWHVALDILVRVRIIKSTNEGCVHGSHERSKKPRGSSNTAGLLALMD